MTIFSDITAVQPTYGKCNLYIFNDVSPVLMIKTADQTVFINSKKDGEIVNLYNTIKDK